MSTASFFWVLAFICFTLEVIVGLMAAGTGRVRLMALGLAFAAAAHVFPDGHI